MDPNKLKVVELRSELAARGLDQKGVKAVLVTRLQEALIKEGVVPAPDTTEQDDKRQSRSRRTRTPSPEENIQADSKEMSGAENSEDDDEDEKDDDDGYYVEKEEPNIKMEIDIGNQDENGMDNEEDKGTDENVDQKVVKSEDMKDDTKNNQHVSDGDNDADTDCEDKSEKKDNDGKDDEKEKENSADEKKESSRSDSDRKESRKRKYTGSRSPASKRSSFRRHSPDRGNDDFTNEEDEPEIDPKAFGLSWVDSDLYLKIYTRDYCSARPISDGPLGLAWAGARSTFGVTEGKVAYEVQITDQNRVAHALDDRYMFELRCGWSVNSTDLQLGEHPLSFSYGGSGKKATNNEFKDYGCKFGSLDVIGVYLDMDSSPCTIEFTVNGESQGIAFEFEKSVLNGQPLYAHIATKNFTYRVNFGQMEKLLLSQVRPRSSRRRDSSRDRKDRRSDRGDRDRDRRDSSDRKHSKGRERDRDRRTSKETKEKNNKEGTADGSESSEHDGNNDKTEEVGKNNDDEDEEMKEADEPTTDVKIEKDTEVKKEDVDVKQEDVDENSNNDIEDAEKKTTTDVDVNKNTDEIIKKEKDGDVEMKEDEKTILAGYEFIGKLPEEKLIPGLARPESRKDCEVILLIGLPGAGKTHWAINHAKENPDKHYNILGARALLDKMRVNGEPRRKHYHGNWDRFVDWYTRSLHAIQDIATKRRRNYIIDQTNVFSAAQRRKMKGFGDFTRIAVVIIPDDEEYKKRFEKRNEAEGKDANDFSLNEMKASFSLPTPETKWFDEIRYTDLGAEEAKKLVDEYIEKGNKALPSSGAYGERRINNNRRRDDRDRDFGYNRHRSWGSQGSGDRRGVRDSYRPPPPPHWRGSGGYDRRDRWQGSGGGYGNNWVHNSRDRYGDRRYGDDRRFDDRQRFDDRGFRGGGRRDFDDDRNRRDDRRSNNSRSDRDFRHGNRDNRLGDNRNNSRGVPQNSKDDSRNYNNFNSTNQSGGGGGGHWNPNVVGAAMAAQNNYYQQGYYPQSGGDYQQQQQQYQQMQQQQQMHYQQDWQNWTPQQQEQWMQQYQQQSNLNGFNQLTPQQQQQQWMNYYKQQQQSEQQQQNPQQTEQQSSQQSSQQQSQQQQPSQPQDFQNWSQYAQTYLNAGCADGGATANASASVNQATAPDSSTTMQPVAATTTPVVAAATNDQT